MKNIGKLAVLGAVLTASASFAFADTITLGSYGNAGGSTAITGADKNTALVYAGYSTTGGSPYNAAIPSGSQISSGSGTSYEIAPNTQWASALPNSFWVGIENGQGVGSGAAGYAPANGYYTFTTTFNVTSGGIYGFSLDLLADDTVAVFLNGVNEVQAGAVGSDATCSDNDPTCTGAGDVVNFSSVLGSSSVNTLTFVVEQTGNSSMGLDFDGSVTQTPEPSGLILLGTGLVGAAGLLFRRRRVVA